MSQIKMFDRTTVRLLRDDLDAALQTVAKKYGISIQTGNARFSSENVTFKLEAAVVSESGVAVTNEASEFKRYAALLGLDEDDLGKSFSYRGQPYEIVGAKLSSRKYPILVKNRNGKVYKFMVADVREALGERAGLTRSERNGRA